MLTLVRRSGVLLLLFCLGCSAQSAAPSDTDRRTVQLVRAHYKVSPTIDIAILERHASGEFTGYDMVKVKLSRGEKSSTLDMLVSRDGKQMLQVNKNPMDEIDVAGRPVRGNHNAHVTIVNFDDFQCPYCAANHQALMNDVLKQYGDRVRVIYKDYPLESIHPWARHAAIDSHCLVQQGGQQGGDAFWDFADYVHANQKTIDGEKRALSEKFAALDKAAEDAGKKHNVDEQKLQACLKAQPEDMLKQSLKEADALDISATPTMFINGQKFDGAVPLPELVKILNRTLADAGEAVPAAPANSTAQVPTH